MPSLLYVFLGGGLGSMVRYGFSQYLVSSNTSFPVATFVSNIIACLVLGFLLGLQLKNNLHDNHSLLFITGFCGGFSTFSTFSAESLKLFQNDQVGLALFYIGGSIIFGLLAVYMGYKVQTLI